MVRLGAKHRDNKPILGLSLRAYHPNAICVGRPQRAHLGTRVLLPWTGKTGAAAGLGGSTAMASKAA